MAATGDWQSELNNICQSCPGEILSRLKNCCSDEERIKIVQTQNVTPICRWVQDYFKNCHQCSKSHDKSIGYKTDGNKLFQKRLYQASINKYTEAILFAPQTTEAYSQAFGNRSASLFHLKSYKECLTDICEALKTSCPPATLHKLYIRKAHCLHKLGKTKELHTVLSESEEVIEDMDIESSKKDQFLKEVQDLRKDFETSYLKKTIHADVEGDDGDNIPELYQGAGKELVQASSAVRMQYNQEQGRFLTATHSIRSGDTLIVEKPFAAVLLPDHYSTHCHHCFIRTKLVFPCRRCVNVVYCSPDCVNQSWKQYHHLECDYLKLLESVGIAHLSLRVVLKAGLPFLLDFRSSVTSSKSTGSSTSSIPGLDESGQYSCTYNTVYHLLPHSDNMAADDLLQYTLTAELLLQILKDAKWFRNKDGNNTQDTSSLIKHTEKMLIGKTSNGQATKSEQCSSTCTHDVVGKVDDDVKCSSLDHLDNWKSFEHGKSKDTQSSVIQISAPADHTPLSVSHTPSSVSHTYTHDDHTPTSACSEVELYIGGLLLRHIQQLVCNAHAITEIQRNPTSNQMTVEDTSQERVATAIYPTASLMNHSCDPTIISSFYKDTLIVRSVKHLPKGGEIFNCYGPHCKRMCHSERQRCLKEQYFFTCRCPPCTDGEQNDEIVNRYKCQACESAVVPCPESNLFTCSQCSWTGSVDISAGNQADQLFQTGLQLLEQNNLKDAYKTLETCHEKLKSVMYKHSIKLSYVRDSLAKTLAMAGDFKKAAKYLEGNMATVEDIYGERSIEVGNELQKLSEVLISAHLWKRALNVIERAVDIFTVNYGKSHDSVKELSSARKQLLEIIG